MRDRIIEIKKQLNVLADELYFALKEMDKTQVGYQVKGYRLDNIEEAIRHLNKAAIKSTNVK